MTLLRKIWSSSDFESESVTRYAEQEILHETQQGVIALGALTLLLTGGLAAFDYSRGLGGGYVYTFIVLALLSIHVGVSAMLVGDTDALNLLGMVLLALCALAFVLLAQRSGEFNASMFSSIVLLFVVVPLVPWGVREALLATGILYLIFTASTLSVAHRFTAETLWTLQFLMVSGGAIALTLVARSILVRKAHIEAKYALTCTNEKLLRLSNEDALTGAWNRRFLEENFDAFASHARASGAGYCLGLVDVDKFKELNDTYGHDCGDRVLQRLAAVLMRSLRAGEHLVRMGGDEFALLLHGGNGRERLGCALEALTESVADSALTPVMPELSVGLVRVPDGCAPLMHDVYIAADRALYAAKARQPAALVVVDFDATRTT